MALKPSDIDRPSPGTDPGVRAAPLRIEDNRGRALAAIGEQQQRFGQTMFQVANAVSSWAEKRKASQDGTALDRYQLEMAKELPPLLQAVENDPSDDPNFVEQFDSGPMAEADQRVRTKLKDEGYSWSEDGERRIQQANLNIRTQIAPKVAQTVNNARVFRLVDQNSKIITEKAKLAGGDGDIAHWLGEVDKSVDSVIDAIPYDKRDAYRKAAHQEVYEWGIRGMTERAARFAEAGDTAAAQAELDRAEAVVNGLTGFAPLEEPQAVPGMIQKGNIDLNDRTPVEVEGGTATVRSMGIEIEGKEVLIPTVADGRDLTPDQAVNRFMVTHEHLGVFDTREAADAYAKKLHGEQEALISGKVPRAIAVPVIDRGKAHGVDPVVLLAIGKVESNLNPSAKNPASSAAGLGQFISETGQTYGLPADASKASVKAQSDALARFTADNIKALRNRLGVEPTPGEVYLAHFLGAGRAANVIAADGETPLWKLLPAKVLQANPQLKNWNAGDVQAWASEKMQGAMEYVTDAGFIEGRKVASNEAIVPLDTAVRLHSLVDQQRQNMLRMEEARLKAKASMIDPGQPADKRDPAGFVQQYDQRVRQAYLDASTVLASNDADDDEKAQAFQKVIEISLESQGREEVPERLQKALPNAQAKQLVQTFIEASGVQARDAFYDLKAQSGKHWDKVFPELVEQGLPATYHVLNLIDDPYQNAAQVNTLVQGLNQKEADLKEGLGTTSEIKQDILDPIEDRLAPYMQAYELGYGEDAQAQMAGYMQAFKNAALVHYRQNRDASGAVEFAAAIMEQNLQVVEGGNLAAVVPKDAQVTAPDIEDAVTGAQMRDKIAAFDPVPFSEFGLDPEFDKTRTISAASNRGGTIWVTNPAGDGLILLVRFNGSTATSPLINRKGEYFELKFKDVPKAAKDWRSLVGSEVPVYPGALGAF